MDVGEVISQTLMKDAFHVYHRKSSRAKVISSMHIYIYVAIGPFPIKDNLDDHGPTVRTRNLLTDDFL